MHKPSIFGIICMGLLCMIILGLSGCSPASPTTANKESTPPVAKASSAPAVKVIVSYSAPTAAQALGWIALDTGLFKKYGIEAEMTNLVPGNQVVAVAGGHVNVALGPASTVVSAMLEGADVMELALLNKYIFSQFYAQKNIKSAADLKGKLVGGLGKYANTLDTQIDASLKALGLDPEKDVQRQYMSEEARIMAFFSGQIDATILLPPHSFRAAKEGYTLLYDIRKDKIPNPSLSIFVNRSWLNKNRDLALNTMKALTESIMVMQTQPDASAEVIMKWTQETDRAIAKISGEYYAAGFDRVPKWNDEHMKIVLGQLAKDKPKAATANPSELYDNTVLEELERTGFIDTLWGKPK